jgi:adenosylcobinamide-GDP ribazoletransferase
LLTNLWRFSRETALACTAALQFLTVAGPLGGRLYSDKEMGRAVGAFPLVGLMLGGTLVGADALLGLVWKGNGLQVALLLAIWVILTGALHADGFLDCCDGLFGGRTPQERLDIMRDPHVGAFGVIGGVLLFLLKFTALNAAHRWTALLLAPTLARWCVSWAVFRYPYARAEGLGRMMKDNVGWPDLCFATVIAVLLTGFVAIFSGPAVPLFMAAAFFATCLLARLAMKRIPGLTGDVYGAICELTELLVLALMSSPFVGS